MHKHSSSTCTVFRSSPRHRHPLAPWSSPMRRATVAVPVAVRVVTVRAAAPLRRAARRSAVLSRSSAPLLHPRAVHPRLEVKNLSKTQGRSQMQCSIMKNPEDSNDKTNRELPFVKFCCFQIIKMEINFNPAEVKEKKSNVTSAPELLVGLGCAVCFAPLRRRLFCLAGLLWILVHKIIFCSFQTLFGQCTRKMSTTAAALNSTVANGTANSGLKLLVTKGPQAQKAVGIWLFGCAAWVFSLVILGGITRLTRSGLSMTDWKFTGEIPPVSDEAWLLEFEKYKQSPEYKRVNKGMSLEDFKFIYWMEYAHRMWGRALGFVFAVPFAYFVAKGYVTRQLGLRLSALFALGGGQGLIGWWMVKSGLEEPTSEYVQPRVSPYRLATHLTSAFVIYCGILWTALSVVMPDPPTGSMNWVNGAAKIRKLAIPVSAVVGITAISGAFIAGNDAGHAFNSFPKMGDTWIPEDVFSMEPFIRNFFENTSTVQLNHRILATTTLLSVGGLWLAARKIDMHPAVKSLIGSTLGMAALQVTLGISTLLMYVPTSLGSAHQAGALTLLSLMILLTHTLRRPSPALLKSLATAVKST